jgi:hypothetical protein
MQWVRKLTKRSQQHAKGLVAVAHGIHSLSHLCRGRRTLHVTGRARFPANAQDLSLPLSPLSQEGFDFRERAAETRSIADQRACGPIEVGVI